VLLLAGPASPGAEAAAGSASGSLPQEVLAKLNAAAAAMSKTKPAPAASPSSSSSGSGGIPSGIPGRGGSCPVAAEVVAARAQISDLGLFRLTACPRLRLLAVAHLPKLSAGALKSLAGGCKALERLDVGPGCPLTATWGTPSGPALPPGGLRNGRGARAEVHVYQPFE